MRAQRAATHAPFAVGCITRRCDGPRSAELLLASDALPILDTQVLNTGEFGSVVRDESQPSCFGLTGDQDVVWTDRSSAHAEESADFPSLPRVLLIELHDFKLQRVDESDVTRRPLASVSAVIKLVCDD